MRERQWNVRDAILWGAKSLKKAGVQTSRLDAELIMSYALKCERSHLIAARDRTLSPDEIESYAQLIKKRIKGIPVAYITGVKEFMGMDFAVNPSVLIPRPDTEVLVESVIDEIKKIKAPWVLDIGTGCGCIGISIARFVPDSVVCAVDVSAPALEIAAFNARKLSVDARVFFYLGDLYSALPKEFAHKFDAIVSNPPYIPSRSIKDLPLDVRSEPVLALDGGEDGLDFYRRIISGAPLYLKKEGILAFEVGYNQAREVASMMSWYSVYTVKDLSGIERVVVGRRVR
ncbi:peptide chain release factor N(5)-glutamine methyltransferase [Caldanaerobius polysaccharolyticus]|uniref:peptide chain release factor N(5)-glutamine methyltransferase n=1 Tax=Caldanaerobius polysaccharolyticus TaxID=44256 RepID=UPI00055603D2|nr:peptide chain release factor N(5)-glutamine methyltransferase [Caldanaerobius polysaccharolyticus]